MKNKKQIQEDKALLEALSPVINDLIDDNYKNSKDKIASQMAPLMGSAIREQIKSQKDDIVDALYPVIGNMINKYVTKSLEEMLNSVNNKIQNGLSFEALKRKIKAKSEGISETELLLDESSNSRIKAILLMHKETGIILAQAYDTNTQLDEPEMIASMMTAIRSFANDWIEKNETHNEIGEINYGGSKILIENSDYSYLATLTDGTTYNKTYTKIRTTLENILLTYGSDIRRFNGNLSQFPDKEINKRLALLLENNDIENKKKKLHPIIYIAPILLLAFSIWNWYAYSMDNTITKKTNEIIYKTPQLTTYRITTNSDSGTITLKGEVPLEYHKSLAQSLVEKIDGVKDIKNEIIVVHSLEDPMQISSNIHYLLNGLNSNAGVNLTYKYKYPSLKISGSTWDLTRKNGVISQLKKIDGVKDIIDDIKIVVPKIETILYFDRGISKVSQTQEKDLIKLISLLKQLDSNLTVNIKGYSDHLGTKKANKKIVINRARNVANFLKEKGSIEQKIKIFGINEPNQKRCAIITLEN